MNDLLFPQSQQLGAYPSRLFFCTDTNPLLKRQMRLTLFLFCPLCLHLLDIYPCQVYINHLYFFLESSFLWWSKVKTCLAKISAHPGAGAPRDHFCHPPGSWRGIPLLLPLACPTVSPPAPCPLTCQCKERSFLSMGSWVMVLL